MRDFKDGFIISREDSCDYFLKGYIVMKVSSAEVI